MKREEALTFLNNEIARLRNEEHVNELFRECRAKELSHIECRITKAVLEFLSDNEILLRDDEIADGDCASIALWAATNPGTFSGFFDDEKKFAHRLAKETGPYGENIAAQIIKGQHLSCIFLEDLFSDKYAEEYRQRCKFESTDYINYIKSIGYIK